MYSSFCSLCIPEPQALTFPRFDYWNALRSLFLPKKQREESLFTPFKQKLKQPSTYQTTMSHSDFKAKDALDNFSHAVTNAQSVLAQDQERLAQLKAVQAAKQEALNTFERQFAEGEEKFGQTEARRAHLHQQHELRQAEHEEQDQQIAAMQQPRMAREAEAVTAEEAAQKIQSQYGDEAMELQLKLLARLRDDDTDVLERKLERKKAEQKAITLRLARIAADIKKLEAPTAAGGTSTSSGQNSTSNSQDEALDQGSPDDKENSRLEQEVTTRNANRQAMDAEHKATMLRIGASKAELLRRAEIAEAEMDPKDRRLRELEHAHEQVEDNVSLQSCQNCQGPLLPEQQDSQLSLAH